MGKHAALCQAVDSEPSTAALLLPADELAVVTAPAASEAGTKGAGS